MILGISGKLGSGKSHVARHIQNTLLEYEFKKKSFGYDVKKIASYLTGINMKTILSRKGKSHYLPEWDMTLGEMYQKIGTDCMRLNLHTDAWILSLFSGYDSEQNWVIDDLRFPNEAEAIKERGGLIIRLEGDPKDVRKKDPRDLNHPSETSLDNYKRFDILFNTETENLEDLIELLKQKI